MNERIERVEALLLEAKDAHGVYEATELGGVYDQEWPRWYAGYAVDHGIGHILGHEVTADRLAEQLARGYDEFAATEPEPAEPWSAYLARRIVEQL